MQGFTGSEGLPGSKGSKGDTGLSGPRGPKGMLKSIVIKSNFHNKIFDSTDFLQVSLDLSIYQIFICYSLRN